MVINRGPVVGDGHLHPPGSIAGLAVSAFTVVVHRERLSAIARVHPANDLHVVSSTVHNRPNPQGVENRSIVFQFVHHQNWSFRVHLIVQGGEALRQPWENAQFDVSSCGIDQGVFKRGQVKPIGQRIEFVLLNLRVEQVHIWNQKFLNRIRVGVGLAQHPQIMRVPSLELRNGHEAIIQRAVLCGPSVWVTVFPVLIDPINSPCVVQVIGDVVKQSCLRVVIQVEVVLVACVAIPIATDDIQGHHFEEVGHIEDLFDGARKVFIRRVVQHINQFF